MVFLTAVIIGLVMGGLMFFHDKSVPAAVAAGLVAAGGSLPAPPPSNGRGSRRHVLDRRQPEPSPPGWFGVAPTEPVRVVDADLAPGSPR
ncbi:hypothetical protein [Streptomyces sp. NPDC048845]|uniref:hypothetical protein n=1 Tax=Streptomyces sp. NPDC048845 TaxID=3155390 RepID=UPI0034185B07